MSSGGRQDDGAEPEAEPYRQRPVSLAVGSQIEVTTQRKGHTMNDEKSNKGAPLDLWALWSGVVALVCYLLFLWIQNAMQPKNLLAYGPPISGDLVPGFRSMTQWGMAIFSLVGIITGFIGLFAFRCSRALAVIGLLISLPLATLTAFAVVHARDTAKVSGAHIEMTWIMRAVEHAQTGGKPFGGQSFLPITNSNAELMKVLTGSAMEPFFRLRSNHMVSGEYVDPWGEPYRFQMEKDDDFEITVGTNTFKGNIVVWSSGPNKKNEYGSGDDIVKIL